MGKTRDLFKEIRDTKGTFQAKMGPIKDRNGMDLTEAEEIKEVARIHRRTVLKRPLGPRSLTQSQPSWNVKSNKASGGHGIPVELLQILKDDAVKVLHSICQQIWKTQQWPQDQKRSVFISIPKKGNAKECSNYHTIELISHASKVMLKVLQARLQQYVNCEVPYVQAGFRKGGGARDRIANIPWLIEKASEFQENIYFCFIDFAKASDWITVNCGKF